MKKLFLFAGALMISAIGFSQVAGAPTAGTAAALPGAGVGANTGLSVQNGDDNKVRVRQAGTEQSVLTYQDNGSGLGGNLARVRQTGSVSGVSGYQNAAEVNQSGTANQATSVQEGDLNNAILNQGQNDDASSGNMAAIRQGNGGHAEGNFAATEQDGNDNVSGTLQTHDNSDAWTRQIGNENKNMIVQDAGPNGTDGHEAEVWQSGDRNESAIEQSGAGARNLARVAQSGDDNQSKQWQTTTAGAGMTGNRAVVVQGVPSIFTPTDVPVVNDAYNDIIASVDADAANTVGSGASIGAGAKQVQYGKEQEADLIQFGGSVDGSNYGEQVQAWGWGNDAGIFQQSNGVADNYAKQYQGGDNNRAGLVQDGDSHKSLQTQIGHRNSALSSQRDSGNLLNIHQRGNDNAATSAQHGIGNRALVVQYDGQSFSAQQNLDNLGGGSNQIDAMQLGPDGDFHDAAIECDFEEPMNLDMDYSIPELEIEDICPDC